jgi:hypothetical protein
MGVDYVRGRQTIAYLTNRTGGTVTPGAVVLISGINAQSFVATAVAAQADECIGVSLDTITNNDSGRILFWGYAPVINLTGAAVLRDWVATGAVALQGTPQAAPGVGVFAQVLGTGTTPPALVGAYPQPAGGAGGGLYVSYCWLADQKAQNTSGGGFTQGAWRTRDITTELADPDNICTLAANQITLDSGTYRCLITAPGWQVDRHQARLYNTTGAAVLLTGASCYTRSADVIQTVSIIQGRFTVAGGQALEVQHRCETTAAVRGFGVECNFTTEVYTQAEFWLES